jgi:CheY-like chemotaxis protein
MTSQVHRAPVPVRTPKIPTANQLLPLISGSPILAKPRNRRIWLLHTGTAKMKKNSRITVWIIDGTQSSRRSPRAIFEVKDVVVHGRGRNQELSAEFKPGATSCFLLDASMPEMTASELLLLLRKEGIRLSVVILTEKGRDVLLERVARSGACTVLGEPVDGDTIATLIRGLPSR